MLTFYAGPTRGGAVNPLVGVGNGHLMGRYDASHIDGRACSEAGTALAQGLSRLAGVGECSWYTHGIRIGILPH